MVSVPSPSNACFSRQCGARENKATHTNVITVLNLRLKKKSSAGMSQSWAVVHVSCLALSSPTAHVCYVSSLFHLQELGWNCLQSHSTSRIKCKEPKVGPNPSFHTTEQWAQLSYVGKSVPIWNKCLEKISSRRTPTLEGKIPGKIGSASER